MNEKCNEKKIMLDYIVTRHNYYYLLIVFHQKIPLDESARCKQTQRKSIGRMMGDRKLLRFNKRKSYQCVYYVINILFVILRLNKLRKKQNITTYELSPKLTVFNIV
jgi:hypothetical protein